jgi:sporulation protein YqfC
MISEMISNNLRIPKDILAGASLMHITGQYELYIENYKNIIEYNEQCVKLQGKTCKIYITGKNLHIDYFNNEDMKISGRIKNIEYV